MARREHERRTDLQDIAAQTVSAYQYAPFTHAVHHRMCFGRRRLACGPIAHELHTDEETRASHVTDDRVSLRECFDPSILDLVLQQTSRDCPLINQHPEWYVMDASGHPKINQIAWLVYSDVALLELPSLDALLKRSIDKTLNHLFPQSPST